MIVDKKSKILFDLSIVLNLFILDKDIGRIRFSQVWLAQKSEFLLLLNYWAISFLRSNRD